MKSFGFISYSVINYKTTKEELSHEECKTYAANIHCGSLWDTLTAKVIEDLVMTSAFKNLHSTLCWCGNKTALWLSDKWSRRFAVGRGWTDRQQLGHGQMGGSWVGQGYRCLGILWSPPLPGWALSVSAWGGNFYSVYGTHTRTSAF